MERHKKNKIGRESSQNLYAPDSAESTDREEIAPETTEMVSDAEPEAKGPNLEEELQKEKDKYVRMYAEFENYKKRIIKEKEEITKYGNESLLYDLLPVIDNLEMAIKHSINDASIGDQPRLTGLVQGVEITLKEFLRVLERFGLVQINALNKSFDPSFHHAMSQIERDDIEDNMVIEEFRKGYMVGDKVLRPSLVAVSKKTEVKSQESEVSQKKENEEEKIEEER
ncbi:MAG: nucleotide exchange factor GrpE [Nitrospirae bacterium]|nr:nucleotide exchange factor GrpE [Nitrospirota bacterium]